MGEPSDAAAAEASLEAQELASRLRSCLHSLTPRARLVWWLRAFHDMPARAVADHPGVRSTTGAVDVMFSRAREQVKACLESAGFAAEGMPPGTCAEVWDLIEASRVGDAK